MKILFLEDDLVDQMAFSRWIKKEFEHFQVKVVSSISELKETVATSKFDLLVSDYLLPDGTILDTIDCFPPELIVCISGINNPKKIEELKKSGIIHFFFKDNHLNYLQKFKLCLLINFNKKSTVPQKSPAIQQKDIINLTHLKKAFDYNKEPIKNIIEVFLAHTPKQLQKLKESVLDQNVKTCNAIAHQLKSSFRMMGLFHQMEKLEEIEAVCCSNLKNQEYYANLVAQIQEDSNLAFERLNQELERI